NRDWDFYCDVHQVSAAGSVARVFCQSAARTPVRLNNSDRGDATVVAASDSVESDQAFRRDRAGNYVEGGRDKDSLSELSGIDWHSVPAGERERLEIPQTAWMSAEWLANSILCQRFYDGALFEVKRHRSPLGCVRVMGHHDHRLPEITVQPSEQIK